jgi:hypothetical protein
MIVFLKLCPDKSILARGINSPEGRKEKKCG